MTMALQWVGRRDEEQVVKKVARKAPKMVESTVDLRVGLMVVGVAAMLAWMKDVIEVVDLAQTMVGMTD